MFFSIHTPITSVGIQQQVGADSRVIHRCIEYGASVLIGRLYIYFRQISVPSCTCVFSYFLKIPVGYLCIEIVLCAFFIGYRQSDFHQYFFYFWRLELQQHLAARLRRTVWVNQSIAKNSIGKGLRELSIETSLLIGSPVKRQLISFNLCIAHRLNTHFTIGLMLNRIIQV